MASQIAGVRNKPFVILAIADSHRELILCESKLLEITKTLEDMSLRFARQYFSTVYVDEIESACKTVLGIVNLGIMFETNKDLDKAKILLAQRNIVDFFRIGWTKIQELEKINPDINQAVYYNFPLESNKSIDSLQLFINLSIGYRKKNALKQLNNNLIRKYYDASCEDELDQEIEDPSHKVCTVIIKLFLGTNENKGALSKTELLSFVKLSFKYSKEELIDKIYTNPQILELGDTFSANLKEAYFIALEIFLRNQLYPIDELYNIKEANPKYNPLEIACLYSGLNTLDIATYVMSDLTSELSQAQRKKLKLGDDSMVLE